MLKDRLDRKDGTSYHFFRMALFSTYYVNMCVYIYVYKSYVNPCSLWFIHLWLASMLVPSSKKMVTESSVAMSRPCNPKITKGIWAMRIYQTWTAQLKMRVKNSCSEFVNWTLCLGLCCWIPSPIHGIMLSSPGLHEPKAMLAMLVSLNLFWIQGRFLAPLKPAGSWLRDFLQMAKCLKISKRSFYGLSL